MRLDAAVVRGVVSQAHADTLRAIGTVPHAAWYVTFEQGQWTAYGGGGDFTEPGDARWSVSHRHGRDVFWIARRGQHEWNPGIVVRVPHSHVEVAARLLDDAMVGVQLGCEAAQTFAVGKDLVRDLRWFGLRRKPAGE